CEAEVFPESTDSPVCHSPMTMVAGRNCRVEPAEISAVQERSPEVHLQHRVNREPMRLHRRSQESVARKSPPRSHRFFRCCHWADGGLRTIRVSPTATIPMPMEPRLQILLHVSRTFSPSISIATSDAAYVMTGPRDRRP